MIVLDKHIWVWWVQGDPRLTAGQERYIREYEDVALGISAISCWEVAKLVDFGRLGLPLSRRSPRGEQDGDRFAVPCRRTGMSGRTARR